MTEVFPAITVQVSPTHVSKGQMISIHATIFDRYTGEPLVFDKILMEIIDDKGIPVWPLSTVELASSTISKLISTADLDAGKDYTVRVSPSRKLRPLGAAIFTVDNKIIPAALLVPTALLIPQELLSDRYSRMQQKVDAPAILPKSHPEIKIAWLIYRTEKDSKVCPKCLPHEGQMFRPNDPDLILIPRHINCRCHYDIITEAYEAEIKQAAAYAREIERREAYEAYLIARAALAAQKDLKHWKSI